MLNETPEAAHPTKRRHVARKAGVLAVLVAVVVMALGAFAFTHFLDKKLGNT